MSLNHFQTFQIQNRSNKKAIPIYIPGIQPKHSHSLVYFKSISMALLLYMLLVPDKSSLVRVRTTKSNALLDRVYTIV